MRVWMLLFDKIQKIGLPVQLKATINPEELPIIGIWATVNPFNQNISNSAQQAAEEVYRILRTEDIYPQYGMHVNYELLGLANNREIDGKSAGLPLALEFAIRARLHQEFFPLAIAATGEVLKDGVIKSIEELPNKLQAALDLPVWDDHGGKFFYPEENSKEISDPLREQANAKGVELIGITCLREALENIGIIRPIEEQAEEIYNNLPDQASRDLLPRLIRFLTEEVDQRKRPLAQDMVRAEFPTSGAGDQLINAFVKARLLISERPKDINSLVIVKVTCQALLSKWPRALEQIKQDQEWFPIRNHLKDQEERCSKASDKAGALLTSTLDLKQAAGLKKAWGEDLDQRLHNYINESLLQAESKKRQLTSIVLIITSIVAVIMLVLSFWVWHEQSEAKKQKDAALSLINNMQFSLYYELKDIAQLDLLESAIKDVQKYFDNENKNSGWYDWSALGSQAAFLINSGDVWREELKWDKAQNDYDSALAIYIRLTIHDDAEIKWKHGLMLSYLGIANLEFDRGQQEEERNKENAVDHYKKAVDYYRKTKTSIDGLDSKQSSNHLLQMDLASSEYGIATTQRLPEEAIDPLKRAEGILHTLVNNNNSDKLMPENALNRKLWKVRFQIANMLRKMPRPEYKKAGAEIDKAFGECNDLIKQYPNKKLWQYDLAFILYIRALILNDEHDEERAKLDFHHSLEKIDELVRYDHHHQNWQETLTSFCTTLPSQIKQKEQFSQCQNL